MIKIRPLQNKDKKQLLNLAIDFFEKNQRGEIVSKKILPLLSYKNYNRHVKEDVKKYMKDSKKEAIFVAEKDKTLIGYIYGKVVVKPKMVLSRIAIVEDWFVIKKYRGKGISLMLWNRLMKWFKKKKCRRIELDVYTTNKHAIDVYHKMGFLDKTIVMTKKL